MSVAFKIFTSSQVRQIDARTIAEEPIRSVDLMERASLQMYLWISSRYDQSSSFVILAGPGNNGGDALVIARLLSDNHYKVEVILLRISDHLSGDAQINLDRLRSQAKVPVVEVASLNDLPAIKPDAIIIDGIFGSGLTRPAGGFAAKIIRHLNCLPNTRISVDIPSGLFGEDNKGNIRDNILKADITLSLEFPSLSFFFAENSVYAGKWEVLPIGLHPHAIAEAETDYYLITDSYASSLLMTRKKFSHKGSFGHVLLIAGSYGMLGAAVLGTKASLRTGSGLVSAHVPGFGYQIIQATVPEALISIDGSDIIFTAYPDLAPFSAVGIGPGLGNKQDSQQALYRLIKDVKIPLIVDADGLNILSMHPDWMSDIPPLSILTPHPGEFDRLAGESSSAYERHIRQRDYSKKYGVIIVLKGAHTSIVLPDGRSYFNTTGNPGMATAGSGDVLSGIILSLLGQGYQPEHAAVLGVYIHGLAGDIALQESSEEALIAGDIIDQLGPAFRKLKELQK